MRLRLLPMASLMAAGLACATRSAPPGLTDAGIADTAAAIDASSPGALIASQRYLHFAVNRSAPSRKVTVQHGGAFLDEFQIQLSADTPEFWAFLDVGNYQGEELSLTMPDGFSADVLLADVAPYPNDGQLYRETYRPQFHFTARRGWINDPNGLVYDDGEYHLYFQHNPYGTNWANMHWGHAVSTDLVHWQELPIALYPHAPGDAVFSGSAVVDSQNTSGFRTGSEAVLVAAFTSTARGECIVYSNDRGRTFREYEGNPVITHYGRDPKLLWFAPGGYWVMVVYDQSAGTYDVAFYSSPDLKTWTYQSRISGFFECPDLFELPVDGDASNTRWVLSAADGAYRIGSFDGKVFTPETDKIPYQYGNNYYAAQTFDSAPGGRRIRLAFGKATDASMPFSNMMTFPVELALHTTPLGPRLLPWPVAELAGLRGQAFSLTDVALAPDAPNPLATVDASLADIDADFVPGSASEFGFSIHGDRVSYQVASETLTVGSLGAAQTPIPLPTADGHVRLRILVDRESLEIFGNDGLAYVTVQSVPTTAAQQVSVFTTGGDVTISQLHVFPLQSAWN